MTIATEKTIIHGIFFLIVAIASVKQEKRAFIFLIYAALFQNMPISLFFVGFLFDFIFIRSYLPFKSLCIIFPMETP